jgi:hypothetical protein
VTILPYLIAIVVIKRSESKLADRFHEYLQLGTIDWTRHKVEIEPACGLISTAFLVIPTPASWYNQRATDFLSWSWTLALYSSHRLSMSIENNASWVHRRPRATGEWHCVTMSNCHGYDNWKQ